MPDLVDSRTSLVEGRSSGTGCAEAGMGHHNTVCRCSSTRELRVAQQSTRQLTHPDVEVLVPVPSIHTA